MFFYEEKPAKKVKFSSEAKETNFHDVLTKPHVSKLRKKWLSHSSREEYPQLQKELEIYKSQGGSLDYFFIKEGTIILSWALIDMNKAHAIKFIIENIPKQLILTILEKNNYSLIRSFLDVESSLELYKPIEQQQKQDCIEKIKLLIGLDQNAISAIFKEKSVDINIAAYIKANIIEVVRSYNNESEKKDQLKPI